MAEERKTRGRSRASGSGGSRSSAKKGSGGDQSHTTKGTAPSAANIEELEKFEPSEEAKRHEPSTVDAMGQDKRRQVIGHSYGPSRRSQFMFFGAVATVLIVVIGGWFLLVSLVDTTPKTFPDRAPWSKPLSNPQLAAEQQAAPKPPDTPCGEPGNAYPAPAGSPCASTESKPTLSSGGK
jgi:hypothetical protein